MNSSNSNISFPSSPESGFEDSALSSHEDEDDEEINVVDYDDDVGPPVQTDLHSVRTSEVQGTVNGLKRFLEEEIGKARNPKRIRSNTKNTVQVRKK